MPHCAVCHRRLVSAPCPHDGWTLPAAAYPAAESARPDPPEVPGINLVELLGAGGFAVVWGGTREDDGGAVSVKVARASTPVGVERFRREAEALTLVGPPHVPRCLGHGLLDGARPYIVMERLFGETLGEYLARQPVPLPVVEAVGVADQVAAALEAAHGRGVVHRDLKPDNVFLTEGGRRAVLLDFGLVRRLDAPHETDLTRSGVVVGTPEYMAPEQLSGAKEVGPAADLYALGVILYELLTLRLPFVGEQSAVEHGHLALRPPRPSAWVPMPAALEDLLLSCLAKEPERRPASAAALRRALAAACAAPAEEPAPSTRTPSTRGSARLIGEGRQPVVLAAIESRGDASVIVRAAARHGGFVAWQRGNRYVVVLSGRDVEDPARAGVAVAREVAEALPGARAALHLASVTVRRREGGAPMASGRAVDRLEEWLPPEPWGGVMISPELAGVAPDLAPAPRAGAAAWARLDPAAREADGPAGADPPGVTAAEVSPEGSAAPFEADSAAEAAVPLLGRAQALDALEASARAAFEEGQPALVTILGEPGEGKSRLCQEAAALARKARPDARVLALSAPRSGAGAALFEALMYGLDITPARGPGGGARVLAEALRRRAAEGPVAVVLDDAHWVEGEVLDALEVASMEGGRCALWVVVAAHPRLSQVRPSWGARTRRHERLALGPLDEAAAAQLAAELLRPAEYPPAATLERLARWSAGNPSALVEIVRALKRSGAVRRRPNTPTYHLATANVEALPASAAWQWLTARQLSAMPPELAACVRLCAVLGVAFTRAELAWVEDALERAGEAASPLDAGYGLQALSDERVLVRSEGDWFSFRSEAFQDAVYDSVAPAQRAAIHERALSYWRERAAAGATAQALERLTRHAAACDRHEEAADGHLELGRQALARHRHVEADQHFTAALGHLGKEDLRRRLSALAGRGRCRYPSGSPREGVEDLRAARALAARLGDRATEAEVLLEEATALDWLQEYGASAQRTEEARPIVLALGDARLRLRLRVAEGRAAYRRSASADALELLEGALADGSIQSDHDTHAVALLVLSCQLVTSARLDDATPRFEEVIRLTREAGDRTHLAVAHFNRGYLWYTLHESLRAIDDLEQAIRLAREIGDPRQERNVSMGLAEELYQAGRYDEALAVASRARMLEERFWDRPTSLTVLFVSRILLAMGRLDDASAAIRDLLRHDLPAQSETAATRRALFQMLRLVLAELESTEAAEGGFVERWREVTEVARAAGGNVHLEILFFRATMALRAHRADDAREALALSLPLRPASPLWGARLEELDAQAGAR